MMAWLILLLSNTVINFWTVTANQAGSFTLFPRNVTQVQGLDVEFFCRHSTADRIVWSVNATYLYSFAYNRDYIIPRQYQYTDGFEVYSLTVTAIPEYNGTRIQCHARFYDGSPQQASEPVALIIEGTPSAVGDLMINVYQYGLSVLWTAPFTLIKDVTYCIDVHNNSDRSLIVSECGINATQYNLTVVDPTPCDSVSITVTPVNRAGNGTQQTIDGYFYNVPDAYDVSTANVTVYKTENTTLFSIAIPYTPLCTCGLAIAMLKGDIGRTIYTMDVVGCNPRNITICGDLPDNQHYNLIVEILNAAGSGFINISISTHHVQDFDVSDISRNNTVFIRFRFTENSSSLGAFVILVRLYPDGSVRLNESIYTTSPRHDNTASIIIHDVPIGIYNVLAYDIESNGLLSGSDLDEMTVASPAFVHGPIAVLGTQWVKFNGTHIPNELLNVTIQPVKNTTMININCTLHEAPPSHGCIVVIQPTTNLYSQLIIKVLPRTNIEGALIDLPGEGWYHVRVYPWTSGGLLTSDMAWMEDIHVTAIFDSSVMIISTGPVSEDDSPVTMATNTQPATTMIFKWVSITLGAVVSVLVLLLLVTICMIIMKSRKHQPKSPQVEETGLDLYEQVAEETKQTEVIYDQPQTPPPQPENMQPCVAYEVSHRRR